MLNDQIPPPSLLSKLFDTFLHLPTLCAVALLGIWLVWQLYDIGFNFGDEFFRLNSNQGNLTLYWADGCCRIGW